jgi:hypothetical protein
LLTAARYVALNPVRAGLVNPTADPVGAALRRTGVVTTKRWCGLLLYSKCPPNWRRLLISVVREDDLQVLRGHEQPGRRLDDEAWY